MNELQLLASAPGWLLGLGMFVRWFLRWRRERFEERMQLLEQEQREKEAARRIFQDAGRQFEELFREERQLRELNRIEAERKIEDLRRESEEKLDALAEAHEVKTAALVDQKNSECEQRFVAEVVKRDFADAARDARIEGLEAENTALRAGLEAARAENAATRAEHARCPSLLTESLVHLRRLDPYRTPTPAELAPIYDAYRRMGASSTVSDISAILKAEDR